MTVTADAGVRGPQPESGWSLKRGPLDHDEVEHPILMPCPLAILGCAGVAIEGGLTGPGHPREHLEPGLHDGTGQRIGVVGRHRLEEVTVGIPGAPGFPHREARALSARSGGIRVHLVYVPNRRIPDFDHNRSPGAALRDQLSAGAAEAMVCGDMNIAPIDEDVFDPAAYVGHVDRPPGAQGQWAKRPRSGHRRSRRRARWRHWPGRPAALGAGRAGPARQAPQSP